MYYIIDYRGNTTSPLFFIHRIDLEILYFMFDSIINDRWIGLRNKRSSPVMITQCGHSCYSMGFITNLNCCVCSNLLPRCNLCCKLNE